MIKDKDIRFSIEDVTNCCPEYLVFKKNVETFDKIQEQYNIQELSKQLKQTFALSLSSINNKINMTFNRFENRFRKMLLKIIKEKNVRHGNLSNIIEQLQHYNYPISDSFIID